MARFAYSALLLAGLCGSAHATLGSDGWYFNIGGGLSKASNGVETIAYITEDGFARDAQIDNVHYKTGWNGSGALGYKSGPLRYEAEFLYIYNKVENFNVDGAPVGSPGDRLKSELALLNLYYDFDDTGLSFSPYLGAGLGYMSNDVDLNGTIPYLDVINPMSTSISANVLGYQLSVGLLFNISNNTAFTMAYRFIGSSSTRGFGKHPQNQLGSLAFIYRFDQT